MGNTGLANLTYPELNDSPNVPRDMQELAEDCDRELYRAFPCTSSTRPAAAGHTGLFIRETDTGDVRMSDGSTWLFILNTSGGSGGAGAGGSSGSYHHNTVQSIGTTSTIVAFNTEDIASAVVTKSTQGSGHKFTFLEDGLYAVNACLLYATGAAGSRYAQITNVAISIGHQAVNQPCSVTSATPSVPVGTTKRFTAGDAIVIVGSQTGQSNLNAQGLHLDIAKVAA